MTEYVPTLMLWEQRARLAEAQNHRCCYCGRRMDGTGNDLNAPTLEHVVALHYGGSKFDPANLVAACANCNHLRNRMSALTYFKSKNRWYKQNAEDDELFRQLGDIGSGKKGRRAPPKKKTNLHRDTLLSAQSGMCSNCGETVPPATGVIANKSPSGEIPSLVAVCPPCFKAIKIEQKAA